MTENEVCGHNNEVAQEDKTSSVGICSLRYVKAPWRNTCFVLVLVPPVAKSGTVLVLSSTECFLTINLILLSGRYLK